MVTIITITMQYWTTYYLILVLISLFINVKNNNIIFNGQNCDEDY